MKPASRMLRAISLGVFWRLAPSTRADHAVQKALAWICADPHNQPVGENPCPACHGAAVAARFTDHGGAFASDCAFIDGGYPRNNLSICGDDVSCFRQENISLAQSGGWQPFRISPDWSLSTPPLIFFAGVCVRIRRAALQPVLRLALQLTPRRSWQTAP